MLDLKKIRKQLKGMSDCQHAAFSIRAALRELPMQTAQKKENSKLLLESGNKPKHLLEISDTRISSLSEFLSAPTKPHKK
jgi:5-methylcytosine-specific restriction endonuclease McrA